MLMVIWTCVCTLFLHIISLPFADSTMVRGIDIMFTTTLGADDNIFALFFLSQNENPSIVLDMSFYKKKKKRWATY